MPETKSIAGNETGGELKGVLHQSILDAVYCSDVSHLGNSSEQGSYRIILI